MKTWRERVVEARERGRFTDADVDDARAWATCAVGEQHAAMPLVIRYEAICGCASPTCALSHEEAPADGGLLAPGADFFHAVRAGDFARADSLLDAIEDRVLELKRTDHRRQRYCWPCQRDQRAANKFHEPDADHFDRLEHAAMDPIEPGGVV